HRVRSPRDGVAVARARARTSHGRRARHVAASGGLWLREMVRRETAGAFRAPRDVRSRYPREGATPGRVRRPIAVTRSLIEERPLPTSAAGILDAVNFVDLDVPVVAVAQF